MSPSMEFNVTSDFAMGPIMTGSESVIEEKLMKCEWLFITEINQRLNDLIDSI